MSNFGEEQVDRNLPDGGTQPVKRGPGRPRKSPPPAPPGETWPVFADRATEAKAQIVEAPEKLQSATALAVVTALAGMLAACRFAEYGGNARSLFQFLLDVSPSVELSQAEARKAGDGVTAEFQGSIAARNRIDVMTFGGAEWCRVLAVRHGTFEMPAAEGGNGTSAGPWTEGVEAGARAWHEELAGKGIPTVEGLTILTSDFVFNDWGEVSKTLPGWKARMKAMGQVVLAVVFGNANVEVAAQFTDLPVVDLKTIPLAPLFRVLGVSVTTSLARPGSLERQIRLDLAALAARRK